MHKIQKSIIVARTSRVGYSSLSTPSANAICNTLNEFYEHVEVMHIASSADLELLVNKRPDLVFTGFIHLPDDSLGAGSKHIWFSDYLEAHGICHTGSESSAMQLSLHKRLAKEQVMSHGLKTAVFVRASDAFGIAEKVRDLSFPLFVKPASLGGGEGIDEQSVVHDVMQLTAQITKLNQAGINDILIEEYLSGKEYSVALLRKLDSDEISAMPIELITPPNTNGDRLLSLKVKNGNAEQTLLLDDPLTHTVITLFATDVFSALGARDYGRIDIRCDTQGVPYFLEANLIPSLIKDYGSFPKAAALNENMDYQTVILTIVNLAFERVASNSTEPIAPVAN